MNLKFKKTMQALQRPEDPDLGQGQKLGDVNYVK